MSSFKFGPEYRPHTLAGLARPVGRPQRPLERPHMPLERPQGHLRGLKAGFQASKPDWRLPGLKQAAGAAKKRPRKHEIWLERGRQATVWAHTQGIRCYGFPHGCGGLRTPQNPKNPPKTLKFMILGGPPPAPCLHLYVPKRVTGSMFMESLR